MSRYEVHRVDVRAGSAIKLVGGIRTKAEAKAVLACCAEQDKTRMPDADFRYVILGGKS